MKIYGVKKIIVIFKNNTKRQSWVYSIQLKNFSQGEVNPPMPNFPYEMAFFQISEIFFSTLVVGYKRK